MDADDQRCCNEPRLIQPKGYWEGSTTCGNCNKRLSRKDFVWFMQWSK